MQVKLITITPNAESLIAYIARVSNPSNQDNPDYVGLIRYLIKNKHWSPFEHAEMTVEIKTSRAIAAQLLRHRSFTFQEFSQRYSEATEFEPIQLRKQATKNIFKFLISLFFLAPCSTDSQNLSETRRSGAYTYVFSISEKEAYKIFKTNHLPSLKTFSASEKFLALRYSPPSDSRTG